MTASRPHAPVYIKSVVRTGADIIFDALRLTEGERDAVYEAVINLVEARLSKARSLKGRRYA